MNLNMDINDPHRSAPARRGMKGESAGRCDLSHSGVEKIPHTTWVKSLERCEIVERYDRGLLNSSGNFATFAATRLASSFVSNLAGDRRRAIG